MFSEIGRTRSFPVVVLQNTTTKYTKILRPIAIAFLMKTFFVLWRFFAVVAWKITYLSWRHRLGESRFHNVFRPHENEKPAGIRKAPFFLSRDGLVWRVAQTAEKSGVFKFFRRGVWTEPYKAHCICLVSIRNPLKAVEIDHLSSFPLPTSRYLWTYKKKIPGRWKVATNNGLARYSESHEWIGWI